MAKQPSLKSVQKTGRERSVLASLRPFWAVGCCFFAQVAIALSFGNSPNPLGGYACLSPWKPPAPYAMKCLQVWKPKVSLFCVCMKSHAFFNILGGTFFPEKRPASLLDDALRLIAQRRQEPLHTLQTGLVLLIDARIRKHLGADGSHFLP